MSKALVIVDVQNDYFPDGRCELFQAEKALGIVKELLKRFRNDKLPIYFVQHISDKAAPFFAPDTDGVQIHSGITPFHSESIIQKRTPNSFQGTTLHTELQKTDSNELVICGMMTHMCIDTTVRAAKELGYEIALISDACTTKDLEWHGEKLSANVVQSVYLASLNGKFAKVMTCAEYFQA